jgi:hypothetical protein
VVQRYHYTYATMAPEVRTQLADDLLICLTALALEQGHGAIDDDEWNQALAIVQGKNHRPDPGELKRRIDPIVAKARNWLAELEPTDADVVPPPARRWWRRP